MLKFLKEVVGGSGSGVKDLPYNIGQPYPSASAWGSWTHYRATSKDDGSPVSIFSLSGTNAQDAYLAAARNGVKRLRTVRHPNILSFLHSTETETSDGVSAKVTIYIVTEPVMPLSEKIKELGLEGTQRDEYYALGLHQIAKAVSFLNNDCKLIHGNVCVASVVVTQTLDWKLHAFDVLSEFDGSNESSTGQMLQYAWLIGSQYKPMELAKSDWAAIRNSPPWAIDSWGMGCLIYELFSGVSLGKTEELRNTAPIPKSLLPDYQRLLSSTPSRRLNTLKLIENSEYFQNKLVDTIHFMEILSLKDSVEKDTFFRKLPNLAEQLPRQIVLKKLLPLLASALEFGSAVAPALTALLKMGSWLSVEEFSVKVLPTIVKLFASNDRAIRVALLQHIDQFGESLSAQIVDEQVYPHVATGFSDTSAFLRELTLKAMLILAPKLSQRTISGSLLKYLSKLQVDEEAAIRTNTTILLGNIASYLNEGTRKRVLINAFTVRALRDTFPPARGAGIMALSATSSYYDLPEIATRILPNIVVLTIDPDSDVRSKAFQAVDQFLQIVKQCYDKSNTTDTTGVVGTGISSAPVNASLLGWAMSSLTLKGKPSDHAPVASVSTDATPTPSIASSAVDSPSTAPLRVTSTSDLTEIAVPASPTSTDGWGELENGIEEHENDKDGWDDLEPLEEPKPSPALASIQAAQKRPVSQPVSQAKHGDHFLVIKMRGNKFTGHIPSLLCNISSLAILDLAENKLSGSIPHCLYNITSASGYLVYDEMIQIFTNGTKLNYKAISLPIQGSFLMDLSANSLSGEVPKELFMISTMQFLNLSRNNLTGEIPKEIGGLKNLECLDLSYNKLTGEIPSTISSLSFLAYLNLSYNDFTGQIPLGTQIDTFESWSFVGNPDLCGSPLPKKCNKKEETGDNLKLDEEVEEDDFLNSLYLGMGIGFAVGFWGVCGSLFLVRAWRHKFFRWLNHMFDQLYVFLALCFKSST